MIDEAFLRRVLAEVVREVVREELRASMPPRELSKAAVAAALDCSTATIDRHVRAGMPYQKKGSHRVFDADACRAWLRDRPPTTEEAGDVLSVVTRRTRTRRQAA